MTVYLTILATIFVITQVVRVAQVFMLLKKDEGQNAESEMILAMWECIEAHTIDISKNLGDIKAMFEDVYNDHGGEVMKVKEAREALEVVGGFIADETSKRKYEKITVIELSDALIILKNLLTSKKIKRETYEINNGGLLSEGTIYKCPSCDNQDTIWDITGDGMNYCGECGQRLDWEGWSR